MSNIKEETVHAEMTSPATSATEPVKSSRARVLAILTEIDELLDDYWAGWDAGNGDAVVALMAADGWFSSPHTAQGGYTGEQLANYVDRYGNLEYTQVGPTTVIETRAGYEVAGAERVDEYAPEPQWYLDHFVIVEENGQLRIASHQVISTV
jgi:hypothetical protein